MVDAKRRPSRMRFIGEEDRALPSGLRTWLRSNPSARSDAGTGTGASSLTMLPSTPTCSGHKAPNLGGPGAAPRGHPNAARCAIWQHLRGGFTFVPEHHGFRPAAPDSTRGYSPVPLRGERMLRRKCHGPHDELDVAWPLLRCNSVMSAGAASRRRNSTRWERSSRRAAFGVGNARRDRKTG